MINYSAVHLLHVDGEIYLTLCQGQGGTPADQPMRAWANSWQVVAMATYAGLVLINVIPFNKEQFQEYGSTGYR